MIKVTHGFRNDPVDQREVLGVCESVREARTLLDKYLKCSSYKYYRTYNKISDTEVEVDYGDYSDFVYFTDMSKAAMKSMFH